MGVALEVQIDGTDELIRNLTAFAARAGEQFAAALYQEAEVIMAEAKQLTPVAPDGGTLRNSGHVQLPQKEGAETSVTLGFGGPARDYAVAVHEHLSEHSPPSWRSHPHDIHWNVPGTGPKFLETPMLEAAPKLGQRLADRVKLA